MLRRGEFFVRAGGSETKWKEHSFERGGDERLGGVLLFLPPPHLLRLSDGRRNRNGIGMTVGTDDQHLSRPERKKTRAL